MKNNPELDKKYFAAMWLNIIFLIGLVFISQIENLYVEIPYAILMVLNAIYLVVKTSKMYANKSDI
ncbi:MAG: hypothetical protein HLX47_12920 [Staphylococcus sp.]|uniref:hypothetical protein n=1 Tax=Staphylococcus sp. TaxID=29387 RepID=UPI0017DCE602|nr:hypothetical protein [Staphylococcus sp.]NWN86772.1 hypothetical protein [Staphylococcus sp.]